MNSRNFVDEFNITSNIDENMDVTDYERFENKELLDLLRSKIIQNLIDDNINNQTDIEAFIKEEIERAKIENRKPNVVSPFPIGKNDTV